MSRRRIKPIQTVRLLVQLFFLGGISYLILSRPGPAGVHNICPFALVQVPVLSASHSIPADFFLVGLAAGGFFLLLSFILPRAFCGWVCPVGTLSRIVGWIAKKLGLARRTKVRPNNRLGWLAVGVLFYVALATFISGRLFCMGGCPFFWPYAAWVIPMGALTVGLLGFFLVGSLFYERFFCRWICPYGALLGIAGRYSLLAINKKSGCGGCGRCFDCPMGTLPQRGPAVEGPMCISCMRCIESCGEESCLSLGWRYWGHKSCK